GVLNFGGTLALVNSTLSGNTASFGGGGAYSYGGPLALTSCTVSGNSTQYGCGGVANCYNATVTLGNTIVPGNTFSSPIFGAPDVSGPFTSQGYNLVGVTTGSPGWISSALTGTSAQPLNPVLAPLGSYGGPMQTMALLPGSPAIDAGSNALLPA